MEDGGLEKPNRLHESTTSASHCPPWIREGQGNGRAQGRGEDQGKAGALEKAENYWSERLLDTERERMGRKTKQNKKPWLLHSSCLPLSVISIHWFKLAKGELTTGHSLWSTANKEDVRTGSDSSQAWMAHSNSLFHFSVATQSSFPHTGGLLLNQKIWNFRIYVVTN